MTYYTVFTDALLTLSALWCLWVMWEVANDRRIVRTCGYHAAAYDRPGVKYVLDHQHCVYCKMESGKVS